MHTATALLLCESARQYHFRECSSVVEQRLPTPRVVGSIPTSPAILQDQAPPSCGAFLYPPRWVRLGRYFLIG